MERRLIWLGYSFVIGVATGFFLPENFKMDPSILLYISIAGFLILILRLIRNNLIFWVLLLISSFLLGLNRYIVKSQLPEENILKYIDNDFNARTEIIGDVVREPDIREDKVYLYVKVLKIKKEGWKDWKELPENAGRVLVQIRPTIGDYYYQASYGDRIWVKAPIMEPFTKTNPAGFNYKRYLRRMFRVYGVMYVKRGTQIKKIGVGGNKFIRWCIDLKWKMLSSIKKTMPYPESAFLGGVTLGARAGVPRWMKFQFQATGVAHVLAVSGLHAGFVAILAVVICNLLRLRAYPRLIVVAFSLLVFSIITGARPATIRASLMYTIGLFIYTFGKLGLRKSTQLTIPLAAMIILFMNPLVLPEGSFTLSFMAVWSLAYLTEPIRAFFTRYIRGWTFITFFLSYFFLLSIMVIRPDILTVERVEFFKYLGIIVFLNLFSYYFLERFYPIENLSLEEISKFSSSLKGLIDFFYAQFAIQLGMMGPLSAIYFGRYPIAGVIANFIAIPLIGIIVQVGLISALIHIILSLIGFSKIGLILATILNMGNYIWAHLFIKMAEFFYTYYPYPYTPVPSVIVSVVFYFIILSIAFFEDLGNLFSSKPLTRFIYPLLIILPLSIDYYQNVYKLKKEGIMRVTFLELGFGNGIVLEFPDGKNFLIDCGGTFIRKQDIALTLGKYKIYKINGIIITNPRGENISGISEILRGFKVEKIYGGFDENLLKGKLKYKEFLNKIADWRFLENRDHPLAKYLYDSFYKLIIDISRSGVPYKMVKKGDIIYSSNYKGKKILIKVLHPPDKIPEDFITEKDFENRSLVLKIVYGDFSVLIPSLITNEGEYFLLNNVGDELPSKVLVGSFHGWGGANSDVFIEKVNPSLIVVQYGYGKGIPDFFYDSGLKEEFRKGNYKGIPVLITDKCGAVIVESDGKGFTVDTVLKGEFKLRAIQERVVGIEENL